MTSWMLVIALCTTGHPATCTVERAERFASRLDCLAAASAARADLEPIALGRERVRDCARVDAGPPTLPTRRPM